MDIFFWLEIPSPHLAPCIRALSLIDNNSITCIFVKRQLVERIQQGWTIPDLGRSKQHFLEDKNNEELLVILEKAKKGVNCIGGLFTFPQLDKYTKVLFSVKATVFIIAESGYGTGWRKLPVFIKWLLKIHIFDKFITAYLVMGKIGYEFYHKIGVRKSKLNEFAYQVDTPNLSADNEAKTNTHSKLNLVYVGQLIKRKGLDILFKAIHVLNNDNIILDIIGDGPLKITLQDLSMKLRVSNQINFKGTIKNNEIYKSLINYDCLIVPSRYDGWAAVCNEALHCGLPVIISSAAGASVLIEKTGAGFIFENLDYKMLAQKIKIFLNDKQALYEAHQNALKVAQHISGPQIAQYMQRILEYYCLKNSTKPEVPWTI